MQEPAAAISGETAEAPDTAVERRPDGMPVGKPFEPGRSGNPKGRPKGIARQVRERLGAVAREDEDPSAVLIDFFADVVADTTNSTRDRMYAANWLAERGWGKAPQFAPMEEEDPLDLSEERTAALADSLVARIDEVAERRKLRAPDAAETPEAAPAPET